MAQQNMPPPPNGVGGYPNQGFQNAPPMPTAGHYADMQTLMEHMNQLSGWLSKNREEWQEVQEGLARVEREQARTGSSGPSGQGEGRGEAMVNGNGGAAGADSPDRGVRLQAATDEPRFIDHQLPPNEPTTSQLRTEIANRDAHIDTLRADISAHVKLQQTYEETLTDATERIRSYCFEQQNHIIALHQHYTTLLAQSRNETIEAQLTHQAWQAGFMRLSGEVREAYKAREEEKRPWLGKLRAVKEENRVLRKMAGWEAVPDSDEEEEEEEPVRVGGAVGGEMEAQR